MIYVSKKLVSRFISSYPSLKKSDKAGWGGKYQGKKMPGDGGDLASCPHAKMHQKETPRNRIC